MQVCGRPAEGINAGAIMTAALGSDINRVEEDAGAGAVSAAALDTRQVTKLTDLVDVQKIAFAIFVMEEWGAPSFDPKAEDDSDLPGEQLSSKLPIDMINHIIFEHLYGFDAEAEVFAMQVMKRAVARQAGCGVFDMRYGIESSVMFERIQAEHGQRPVQIIADPNLDTKFQMPDNFNSIKKKPSYLELRIQGKDDLVFIPLQLEFIKFKRIELEDLLELRALPEEAWLALEEELLQFTIENCPKLVMSEEMKAMQLRVEAKRKKDDRYVRCLMAKIFVPIIVIYVPALILFFMYGMPALKQNAANNETNSSLGW